MHDLKSGELDVKTATEMINAAGKMVNIAKVQIIYEQMRISDPAGKTIPYMEQ